MKILFAAALVFPLLSACTDRAENGFEPRPVNASLRTGEPLALRIGTIDGMNTRSSRKLRDALTKSLKRRGVRIVKGRRKSGAIELTGRMSSLNEGKTTAVTYEWVLSDGAGPVARPITGFERSSGGSSDPWKAVDGDMAKRMGERIAQKIVSALQS